MTTRWTTVLQAGSEGPERDRAMELLCRCYWYPVYAFIRRRGNPPEEARDLTQSFFAKLISREWLEGLEKRDARFSTWLLTRVVSHLANEHRGQHAQKRGSGTILLSIEWAEAEHWFGAEPATEETPERIFERRWALAVLEAALGKLRAECARTGKQALFEALSPYLSREPEPGEYAQVAAQLGLARENALAVAVYRLRQQYREVVRAEVAAGLRDPARIDEELRHLAASL